MPKIWQKMKKILICQLIFRHGNPKIHTISGALSSDVLETKIHKTIKSRNHTKICRFTLLFFPKMLIKKLNEMR